MALAAEQTSFRLPSGSNDRIEELQRALGLPSKTAVILRAIEELERVVASRGQDQDMEARLAAMGQEIDAIKATIAAIERSQSAGARPADPPLLARVEPDPAPPLTDDELERMAAELEELDDLDEQPSAAATPNPEPTPATEPEPTPTKRGGRKPDPARDAAWQQAIAMNDQGKSKDSIVAFLNDHGIKTSPGNLSRDMRKARDRLAGITPSAPADQEIGPNTVS